MMLPAGIRSNNPGNIRSAAGSMAWQGEVHSDREGFAAFDTPEHGLRAIMKTLSTYQYEHNLHSVRGIITRWAPPNENDTASYIADACARLGINQDDFLNLEIPDSLIRMAQAIVHHENGACPDPTLPNWYDESVYEDAAEMVLGTKPKGDIT